MNRVATLSALLLIVPSVAFCKEPPIGTVAGLFEAAHTYSSQARPFDVTATVNSDAHPFFGTAYQTFSISDKTGFFHVYAPTNGSALLPGDTVRFRGTVNKEFFFYPCACVWKSVCLSHGPAPEPLVVTAADVNGGTYHDRPIRLSGTITDVMRDDVDSKYVYFVLSDSSGSAYIPHLATNDSFIAQARRLIGATVEVDGVCTMHERRGRRKHLGLGVSPHSINSIRVLQEPPDPFLAPPLHDPLRYSNPVISRDLTPKRVLGKVLATWQGDRLVVRTADGLVSNIHLAQEALPAIGSFVEAVGIPETDLYQLNLSKAIWRTAPAHPSAETPVREVSVREMFTDGRGNREFKTELCGEVISLRGRILALPSTANGDRRINLRCDGFDVPVDFSSIPDVLTKLEIGSEIEVTGICVLESESWRPQTPFPHVKGLSVVLRTPDDVRVTSRPPWWNTTRLLTAIAILLAAVCLLFIWNKLLRRAVIRRSNQLLKEQIARTSSELRIDERTHLAVELHDSLSQNLTGVALEVNAAARAIDVNPDSTRRHLMIAEKTLKSCRNELKNCLWDLRNNMLEENDVNEAIRKTLAPQIGDAVLQVRFDVRRRTFSENTMHAILRIVRELAVNAVRHGQATRILVAGSLEGQKLLFSVRDNGCGFDPNGCPGMAQGHFGLQGIRERIREFAGSLDIESAPGRGTRVTVTIDLAANRTEQT